MVEALSAMQGSPRVEAGRRYVGVALCAVAMIVALSACAVRPATMAPILEPGPGALVWPTPPDVPRYALAKILIGEKDFIAGDAGDSRAARSALEWVTGLLIGEPTYLELQRPVSGMTDDRGWIYVTDASHKAVVVFDMVEHRLVLWKLAAMGQPFASPIAIAGDGSGGFLVTDSELGEVFRLAADGNPTGRFGKGILTRPTGLARDDSTGLIYVADTGDHDVKVFDAGGMLVDILGGHGTQPGYFNAPTHLAFANGELFVADTLNFRVQIFDRAGDERLAFGRLGLFVGEMTRPKGVGVGSDGRIYVVESYYDHLLTFDRKGHLLLAIGGTGAEVGRFYLPSGVWTDALGRVYVADMFNGRIVVFKELTGVEGT